MELLKLIDRGIELYPCCINKAIGEFMFPPILMLIGPIWEKAYVTSRETDPCKIGLFL
jgi:hypothetical protein